MFREMGYKRRTATESRGNPNGAKILALLQQRRDPSRHRFRFISPWATTAVSSTTNTLSPAAPFKHPTVLISIDKLIQPRRRRATNIPWNLALKKYALLTVISLVKPNRDIPS
jgi:hypothetical protein